MSFDMSWCLCC